MKTLLLNYWDLIRDSFWFWPLLISCMTISLALSCVLLDAEIAMALAKTVPWIAVSPQAARSTLTAIAGAMVSTAGIVFSVVLVTLSVTSSQFGSRLLRTFLADRVTQLTLGMLIGTSVFSMVALAGIRDHGVERGANISVILGLVLAVVSIATLVGFIHHISNKLQAPNVVAAVARDLDQAIEELFPESMGNREESDFKRHGSDLPSIDAEDQAAVQVRSSQEGYLQAISAESLMSLSKQQDLRIALKARPGHFIERDSIIAECWILNAAPTSEESPLLDNGTVERVADCIDAAFVTGPRRTPRQDVECALEELVEVAVRALSPGINDPFTAIASIDRLSAALGRLTGRQFPAALRRDENGVVRVVADPTSFQDLLDAAFNQVRQYGGKQPAVAIRLLEGLLRIAQRTERNEHHSEVMRHAEMVKRDFAAGVGEPLDGDDFDRRFQAVVRACS